MRNLSKAYTFTFQYTNITKICRCASLHDSSRDLSVDATCADASFDAEVAIFSPSCAPAVAHKPVISSFQEVLFSSESYHQHSMVELCLGTEVARQYAVMVELQLAGVQCDAQRCSGSELLRYDRLIGGDRRPSFDVRGFWQILSTGIKCLVAVGDRGPAQSLVPARRRTGETRILLIASAVGVDCVCYQTTYAHDVSVAIET
jgi:hypothetical protein